MMTDGKRVCVSSLVSAGSRWRVGPVGCVYVCLTTLMNNIYEGLRETQHYAHFSGSSFSQRLRRSRRRRPSLRRKRRRRLGRWRRTKKVRSGGLPECKAPEWDCYQSVDKANVFSWCLEGAEQSFPLSTFITVWVMADTVLTLTYHPCPPPLYPALPLADTVGAGIRAARVPR